MAGKIIHAAGGIVVRGGTRPRVAVVQRRKDERWVLPRGKLKRNEHAITGARREVVEETGHRVRVRKFLGAVTYRARGRPKVVQFWLMNATARPSRDVTKDIVAVEWLPLAMAIRQLSYPLEKLFLNNVGHAILRRKHRPRRKMRAHAAKAKLRRRRSIGKTRVARTRTAASRRTAPARQTMLQRVIGRLAR